MITVCRPIFLAGIVFDGGYGDDKFAFLRGNKIVFSEIGAAFKFQFSHDFRSAHLATSDCPYKLFDKFACRACGGLDKLPKGFL